MKKKPSIFNFQSSTIGALFLIGFIISACDQGKEQIAALQNDLSARETEIATLATENEKLKERIYEQEGQLGQLKHQDTEEARAALTQPEKDVQTLIGEVHTGWENLAAGGGINSILVFFLPKYTTSSVHVDVSNFAKVKRHNNTNFEEHLAALSEIEGLSIKFDKTQYLYTEVLFTTCYRSRIQIFRNGQLQMTKSIVALIAGEDSDGWKIGNYSWVTLDYAVNS